LYTDAAAPPGGIRGGVPHIGKNLTSGCPPRNAHDSSGDLQNKNLVCARKKTGSKENKQLRQNLGSVFFRARTYARSILGARKRREYSHDAVTRERTLDPYKSLNEARNKVVLFSVNQPRVTRGGGEGMEKRRAWVSPAERCASRDNNKMRRNI